MINYLDFWSLARSPFDAVNDPAFFFESGAHGEALARLLYFAGDQNMGMAALTGEIGAGKTLTLQVLLGRLRPDLYVPVVLYTANGTFAAILGEINSHLRGEWTGTAAPVERAEAVAEFRRLVRERAANLGRHLLVVMDEAQFLDGTCLDELKCLTNPIDGAAPPMSLLLAGQPELKEHLRRLPQVYQRLGLIYHLQHLRQAEVEPYLQHRLAVAGAERTDVFEPGCAELLFSFSAGCPRQINRICKLAVDRACLLRQATIGPDMVAMIIEDFRQQFA